MIVGINKGSGLTGAMRYVQGEGRDDVTGKLKQRIGDNSRAELLGGQGFGFEITSEADADLARRVMEFAGRPENQASRTRPCELDCEHITLSWAKGQSPDNAEKIAAARSVLAALGMANARAVFYAHHDAEYAHIHIVASRIDPDTRRTYSSREDIFKSQAWALQWEREYDQIVPSRQWMHTLADAARHGDHAALRAALTETEATFSRKDVDRAFAWAGYFGSDRTKPRDAFLADREIVPLRERADGPVKAYTTRAILADERAVQRDARSLHGRMVFGLRADKVAAQGIKYGLNREQAEALSHATDAHGFAIIAGQAGVGKSRALEAAREAYLEEGYEVRGLAFTNKVVANMRRDGFEARTITAELHRLARESEAWRGGKTILVVDEAAQLSTKDLGELLRKANERGAKVILTGDDRQLGSIERGGMFSPLRSEFGAVQLQQIQRVKDAEQQKAFGLMHGGKGERDFESALRIFDERGGIHWSKSRGEAIRDLGAKYIADVEAAPDKRRLMVAQSNEEVRALNEFARTLHGERGELGADHVLPTAGGDKSFAAGDRVSITANAPTKAGKAAGLINGAFGQITNIEIAPEGKREVTVELDGPRDIPGRKVSFVVGDNRELHEFNGLKHGYATTVYKSQGDTLDQIYHLHSPSGRANSNYVAMTRHREELSVFVAKDRTKDFDELVRQMSRGQDKTAASNYRYDERDVAAREAARESTARETASARPVGPQLDQGKAAGLDPVRVLGTPASQDKAAQEEPRRPGGQTQAPEPNKEAAQESATREIFHGKTGEPQPVRAAGLDDQPQQPGVASLPDPEVFGRGQRLDQVERLVREPGKTATRLRGAFSKSGGGLDYMRSLEAEGFHLAQIDGTDAKASVQRREDAEAAKLSRMPRVFKEGELVAINRYGASYRIDAYSTGAKREAIDAKVAGIDRGTLPNLETAYFKARIAGIERAAPRGADLAQWRKQVDAARSLQVAQDRGKARGEAIGRAMGNTRAAASGIGYAAMRVLDGLAATIENMTLSPEAKAERKAEDQARRAAQPSKQEIRDREQMAAYRREQDDKTKRLADLATQFDKQLEADRAPGGGREITGDKGSGAR